MEHKNNTENPTLTKQIRSKTKPVSIFLFLFLLLIVLSFFSINWYNSQTIKSIKLNGNSILSNSEIYELIEDEIISSETNDINLFNIEKKIKQHKYVSEARVWFNSKGILGVDINERYPIAITINKFNELIFLDNTGSLLPYRFHKEFTNLPIINNIFQKNGTLNEVAANGALLILNELESNTQNLSNLISEINYISTDNSYKLFLTTPTIPVLFGKAENIQEKLKHLYIFWKKKLSTSESLKSSINFLDIRWNSIVIVKKKT